MCYFAAVDQSLMPAALFRRLNSIAEINDDKETWKIDVRLINMWIIPSMDPSQLTMIHCTQSGNQISGSSLYSVGDRFMHNAKMIYFDEVSKVKKQCFSTTAESNPLLSGSITPAKHNLVLSNTQLDDIPFEDLSSIQLSSIGVTKHIKIE
ncbi:hypothetical protein AAZV13_04G124400 [Glycine max]